MNQKKTKRFRKEVRRRVDANLGVGLDALNKMIRPRPRWIPRAIWVLAYMPLFPKKYIKAIYRHMP